MATDKKPRTRAAEPTTAIDRIAESGRSIAEMEQKLHDHSASARALRSSRSLAAVGIIKEIVTAGIPSSDARRTMLESGMLKGTVSKIITVSQAITDGRVDLADVKSLSGGYKLATAPAPTAPTLAPPSGEAVAPEPEAVAYATPEEMIEAFVAQFVTPIKDKHKRFAESGRLIAVLTEAISKAAPAPADSEDDDDEVLD